MIDEKKLIEDILWKVKEQVFVSEEVGHNRPFCDKANVIECINNQPKISEWISCNERLPETFEKVLVFTDSGCSYIARLNRIGEWVSIAEKVTAKIEHSKVIAWQPLHVVSSM